MCGPNLTVSQPWVTTIVTQNKLSYKSNGQISFSIKVSISINKMTRIGNLQVLGFLVTSYTMSLNALYVKIKQENII